MKIMHTNRALEIDQINNENDKNIKHEACWTQGLAEELFCID